MTTTTNHDLSSARCRRSLDEIVRLGSGSGSGSGLWKHGDATIIRVCWWYPNDNDGCMGYYVTRNWEGGQGAADAEFVYPCVTSEMDTTATRHGLVHHIKVPRHHMISLHDPRDAWGDDAIHNLKQIHPELPNYLVRTPRLVPTDGWWPYLRDCGIRMYFTPPSSWQFAASCWEAHISAPSDTERHNNTHLCRPFKTGGLHMSEGKPPRAVRRCQLSVEYGLKKDSFMGVAPGMKAGVLVYVGNMSCEDAFRTGDICYDTSLTLSFSALLIAYIEMVSVVRREVYASNGHVFGGLNYCSKFWDFTHVPYTTPFPLACPASRAPRTIDLAAFARERALVVLEAERMASPTTWAVCSSDTAAALSPGTRVAACYREKGIRVWLRVTIVDVTPVVRVDLTPHPQPGSLLVVHGRRVFLV